MPKNFIYENEPDVMLYLREVDDDYEFDDEDEDIDYEDEEDDVEDEEDDSDEDDATDDDGNESDDESGDDDESDDESKTDKKFKKSDKSQKDSKKQVQEKQVKDKKQPLFNQEQQAALDKIVAKRISRQETKLFERISNTAGVQMTQDEVHKAARLWGILSENQSLSAELDDLIDTYTSEGKLVMPKVKTDDSGIVLKEAVLDMKLQDPLFLKNADSILQWADDEGFDVRDAKTLKLAYMAWKSSDNGIVARASKRLREQAKTQKKSTQKATSNTPQARKAPKPAKRVDYGKMSDAEILASEGASLFTED